MSANHTAEFKAKAALEALTKKNDMFADISAKYGLKSGDLESWVSELQENAHTIFSASGTHSASSSEIIDVSLESDNNSFITAINYGAEEEGLDISSITKWSLFGIAAVIVFIVALIPFSQYAFNAAVDEANINSTYYDITELEEQAEATLNSYGVVDLEKGIYRIPIDEAINKIVSK